jgi:FkbM family methyltransferase
MAGSFTRRRLLAVGLVVLVCIVLLTRQRNPSSGGPSFGGPPTDMAPRSLGFSSVERRSLAEFKGTPLTWEATVQPDAPKHEFLSAVERIASPDEAQKKRVADLGFTLEPHVAIERPSLCPVRHPLRVAVGKSRSQDVAGSTSVIAKHSSGFAGIEHLTLYRSILNFVGDHRPCVAIDAGGNEGCITTWLASAGCKVFTYEALATNYRRIYSSLRNFPDLGQKVHLFYGAVSNVCGESVFIKENNGGNEDDAAQRNGQIVVSETDADGAVFTRRIDDDVDEDVLLFKIDVEGYEGVGLAGATALLTRRNVPFVHAEFSPNNMHLQVRGSGMLYHMAALGYEIYLQDCMSVKRESLKGARYGCYKEVLGFVVNEKETKARIFIDEIADFVQRMLREPGQQVNLLFFNRRAFGAWKMREK